MVWRWSSRCDQIIYAARSRTQWHAFVRSHRKYAQSGRDTANTTSNLTQNIGIIAHIDAGKTTTTERMLYYSGFTRRIGDVDDGSTVTDFLPAERARGITIQSAAVTFQWPPPGDSSPTSNNSELSTSSHPHNINLIDTPGHADFTFEVLRSLRVLDGAVCILDGVAGVEAQTEKVWAQASAYAIPKIIYVNKLDRDGAAFGRTVREIGARLNVWPAVCSIPWWDANGLLQGVGDVVSLRGLKYAEGGDGKKIDVFDLPTLESEGPRLAMELKTARSALVEILSEHDDHMVESYLESDDDPLAISPEQIKQSLRRRVLEEGQSVVPVFAGASFRNVGVQPLLDAVIDFLPSPNERPSPAITFGADQKGNLGDLFDGRDGVSNLTTSGLSKSPLVSKADRSLQNLEACALAFKVVADAKRGVLVYVRVYSGTINRNALLWNTTLQTPERAQRLMRMYANEAVEIDTIQAGQIGVIVGLKAARTGDTLISHTAANVKTGPPAPVNNLQLRPIDVPPPVFFVSVEPSSLAEERNIKESLNLLLREDPSLHVSTDEESGQTHLSGMGELHLEIARDRLINDFKAKARIGKIEIGYREAITKSSEQVTEVFDREVGGRVSKAACTAFVMSVDEAMQTAGEGQKHHFDLSDRNRVIISTPTLNVDGSAIDPEQASLPNSLNIEAILQSLKNGVSAALARGPAHGYPFHSTAVDIEFEPSQHIFPNTTLAALSSAARLAVQTALRESSRLSETVLMEPVMLVTISVDEASMGSVVHDISSARGGSVVSLGSTDELPQSSVDVKRIYAPPDLFAGGHSASEIGTASDNPMRQVVARVPLKEMVGYLKHLRSLTGGRGTFTMVVDQFEKMSVQRQRAVLNEMRGDYG